MSREELQQINIQIQSSQIRTAISTDKSQDDMHESVSATQQAGNARARVAELNLMINQQRLEFTSINIDNLKDNHQKSIERIDSRIAELDATAQSFSDMNNNPDSQGEGDNSSGDDSEIIKDFLAQVEAEQEALSSEKEQLNAQFQSQLQSMEAQKQTLQTQINNLQSEVSTALTVVEESSQLAGEKRLDSHISHDRSLESNNETSELLVKRNDLLSNSDEKTLDEFLKNKA